MIEGCLASTGTSQPIFIGVGILLVSLAALLIYKKSFRRRGAVLLHLVIAVFAVTLCLTSSNTIAAPVCPASSMPDQSTGLPGQLQIYNVLRNDRPTEGARFVVATLRLSLVDTPVAGSVVSSDGLTVTVPGEGTYTALGDGTIRFQPLPAFRGLGKGVHYTIRDTANNTTSNIYQPRVEQAAVVAACTNPSLETTALRPATIFTARDQTSGEFTPSSGSLVRGLPWSWAGHTISNDGQKMVALTESPDQKQVVRLSVDSGQTWRTITNVGTPAQRLSAVVLSGDGSRLIVSDAYGYVYTSSDDGASWTQTPLPMSYWFGIATSSNGSVILASNSDPDYLSLSTDGGATWTQLTAAGLGEWAHIAISDDGTTLLATNRSTFHTHTSTDGGATWTENTSFSAIYWSDAQISNDGSTMFVINGQNDSLYASHDNGATWTNIYASAPGVAAENVDVSTDGATIVMSLRSAGPLRSTDSGATWSPITSLPAGVTSVGHIVMSENGSILFASTNTGYPSLSYDGGATMTENTEQQTIDPNLIDIDPSTPGLQRSVNLPSQGWQAVYDPATDTYTVTVTDQAIFALTTNRIGNYSLYQENCAQPNTQPIQLIPYDVFPN